MATQGSSRFLTKRLIITSLIAGMLLAIVNSAVWINRQIFDTKAFTETAVTAITSESSRDAIGARITDEALKDNPVAKNIAGDRVANLVSGLLGTDQAEKLLAAAVSRLQIYLTSNNQQDVDIELSGLKSTVTRVIEISGVEPRRIDPSKIPDRLVLVEEKNVPNLYTYGVVVSWLAPLGLLAALILIAVPYLWDRKHYVQIMFVHGALLISVGLISLLLGPLLRPPALEPFHNPNGREVVGNIYDAFISTFNTQTAAFVYIGVLLCLAALLVHFLPRLKRQRK